MLPTLKKPEFGVFDYEEHLPREGDLFTSRLKYANLLNGVDNSKITL